MTDLDLERGEHVVETLCDIYVDANINIPKDLVLTNKNLLVVSKTVFGRAKNIDVYRLRSISVLHGQTSLTLEAHDGYEHLVIQFKSGNQLVVRTRSGAGIDLVGFAKKINLVLTGTGKAPRIVDQTSLGVIKGAFGSLFGLGSRKDDGEVVQEPEHVSTRCKGCRAPISGYAGQVVRCSYCDTKQSL